MSYKILLPYVISTAAMVMAPISNASSQNATSDSNKKFKTENYNNAKPVAAPDTVPVFEIVPDTVADRMIDEQINRILAQQLTPTRAEQSGKSVVYVYSDGRRTVRNGGTRAWRNNNPGNLRYYDFAKSNGAIGEAGNFAVFPDEETGMQALHKLLRTNSYQNLTIANALKRYDYSNWRAYTRKLTRLTGLTANTKLSSLNPTQLNMVAQSIRQLEGWVPGHENKIDAPQYAMAMTQQRVR
ncbi:MAG: hypothetical protein NC311_00735 [Muribaculaceae bacterium]|nr:hypothetical protein [Muribaculaceae bacterium]